MPIDGFVDYRKRAFCMDTKCQVQLKLNYQREGSREYESIREECKGCKAWQFHHWLNEKKYLIVKPEEE